MGEVFGIVGGDAVLADIKETLARADRAKAAKVVQGGMADLLRRQKIYQKDLQTLESAEYRKWKTVAEVAELDRYCTAIRAVLACIGKAVDASATKWVGADPILSAHGQAEALSGLLDEAPNYVANPGLLETVGRYNFQLVMGHGVSSVATKRRDPVSRSESERRTAYLAKLEALVPTTIDPGLKAMLAEIIFTLKASWGRLPVTKDARADALRLLQERRR